MDWSVRPFMSCPCWSDRLGAQYRRRRVNPMLTIAPPKHDRGAGGSAAAAGGRHARELAGRPRASLAAPGARHRGGRRRPSRCRADAGGRPRRSPAGRPAAPAAALAAPGAGRRRADGTASPGGSPRPRPARPAGGAAARPARRRPCRSRACEGCGWSWRSPASRTTIRRSARCWARSSVRAAVELAKLEAVAGRAGLPAAAGARCRTARQRRRDIAADRRLAQSWPPGGARLAAADEPVRRAGAG